MRQLLCFAERSESIAKIDLEVKKENRRAIALYKHFGFVVEGMTRRALFIDGVFYDTIRMGKCIDGDIEEENHE